MNRRHLLLATAASALAACTRDPDSGEAAAVSQPALMVFKTVGCGCCDLWVEHMQKAGFQAHVQEMPDMGPTKERLGVPAGMGSCHTAEVGGYFVEGHVPAQDVMRLLDERVDARGLAVPGMPLGSPGMEMQDRSQPYDVLLVDKDGATRVYAHYGA